jgi:hypothetical protein
MGINSHGRQRHGGHPLGAVWETSARWESRRIRQHAVVWMLLTGTVLALAALVQPEEDGTGTHTQLGLRRCSILLTYDLPCPTCGMTTAFAWAARGRWLAAAKAQPAGCVLALACVVLLIRAGIALATGRTVRVNWYRVRPTWVLLALLGLLTAGWAYKILAMRAAIG